MSGAAIFDLDRTLLRGASGPLINESLREVGLRAAELPGEALAYRAYDLLGENLVGMFAARMAAFAVRGWSVAQMREAGRVAATLLAGEVARYAPGLLDQHRRAGDLLVLATATPYDLVKPLAERLGFDEVVATGYRSEGGRYLGRLDGPFVWGFGKLAALRRLAGGRGFELASSVAYTDSVNDLPLLMAVGSPRAVNPDVALQVFATLRRWPVMHLDVPPGVPTIAGIEPFDLGRLLVRPEWFPYARFDIDGVELLPDEGPFLLVSNHRSYFDVAALALLVARKGRPVRFLGKKELFEAPVVGQLARALGGIPVERAGAGAAALAPAARVLEAGEGLAVLPQGTIPRGRAFFDPRLVGKTGAARLAASSGAPVVPVGLWNTEAVWPRSSLLPKLTNLLSPPTVTVRVGRPVDGLGLGPADAVADTEKIMEAIAALLPPASREHREPSEDELGRTYPRGKIGEERVVGISPGEPRTPAARAGRPAGSRRARRSS